MVKHGCGTVGQQITILTTVERGSILFPRGVNMFDLIFVLLNNFSVFGFLSSAATGYILYSTALLPKLEDFRCWSRRKCQHHLISYLTGCVRLRICSCIYDVHLSAVCLSVLVEVLSYLSEMTSSEQLDHSQN